TCASFFRSLSCCLGGNFAAASATEREQRPSRSGLGSGSLSLDSNTKNSKRSTSVRKAATLLLSAVSELPIASHELQAPSRCVFRAIAIVEEWPQRRQQIDRPDS